MDHHEETEAALLARIHSDPHDADARLVLADALQERGDPLGQLIALQLETDHDRETLTAEPEFAPRTDAENDPLVAANEARWIGDELRKALSDRRYAHGFLAWARVASAVDDPEDPRLSTIRVLAMDSDVDAYRRVVVESRDIMRALRCVEVAHDPKMLTAICESSSPWPFTHIYLSSLASAGEVGAAIDRGGPLPDVKRLTVATRMKHDIEELITILAAKENARWVTKLEMITVEPLDVGAYRATEIGTFLSGASPNLANVILRVNDHLERNIVSAYLARRRDLTPREKQHVKGADKGERYTSRPNETGQRTVRIEFLGKRVGYVGGALEHLRGVNRLEIEPSDPDQITLPDEDEKREAIRVMMNSPAPGIELPQAWSRPPLPPTPEFGSLPVEDLPTYFALETATRAEAWEKIRGWYLNEVPPSFDAPPVVNHLILTSSYAIFCTETNGRLARKFTFTRYMIQRVTQAEPDVLPSGIAPEGYGLYTIHTPSGRTLLIAPEDIARALGAGWV